MPSSSRRAWSPGGTTTTVNGSSMSAGPLDRRRRRRARRRRRPACRRSPSPQYARPVAAPRLLGVGDGARLGEVVGLGRVAAGDRRARRAPPAAGCGSRSRARPRAGRGSARRDRAGRARRARRLRARARSCRSSGPGNTSARTACVSIVGASRPAGSSSLATSSPSSVISVADAREVDLRQRRDVRAHEVDDVVGDEHAERARTRARPWARGCGRRRARARSRRRARRRCRRTRSARGRAGRRRGRRAPCGSRWPCSRSRCARCPTPRR